MQTKKSIHTVYYAYRCPYCNTLAYRLRDKKYILSECSKLHRKVRIIRDKSNDTPTNKID